MPGKVKKPLEWTSLAGRDLLSIEAHYAEYSQITAGRVLSAIKSSATILEYSPLIGVSGKRPGTRHEVISKYPFIIVYRVKPKTVQILRILHQRRKYFN